MTIVGILGNPLQNNLSITAYIQGLPELILNQAAWSIYVQSIGFH